MANDVQYKYHHVGGRVCVWDALQKQWRYGENLEHVCNACATRKPSAEDSNENASDRGEFGHPGIGYVPSASLHVDELRLRDEASITHPPMLRIMNDGWGFRNNTFSVVHGDNKGQSLDMPSSEAMEIFNRILPELLVLFLEKNLKYASVQEGYALGPEGIIPDLNRKLGILVDRIWSGSGEIGESTEEVAMDMVGHLLLLIKLLRDESR